MSKTPKTTKFEAQAFRDSVVYWQDRLSQKITESEKIYIRANIKRLLEIMTEKGIKGDAN